jgi:hypothetical protein
MGECYGTLAEGSVRGAISHVAQAFRAKGRQNPTKNQTTNLAFFYQDILKHFEMKILSKPSKKPYHFQSLMN